MSVRGRRVKRPIAHRSAARRYAEPTSAGRGLRESRRTRPFPPGRRWVRSVRGRESRRRTPGPGIVTGRGPRSPPVTRGEARWFRPARPGNRARSTPERGSTEPVIRKRPGRLSSSTAFLRARMRSGERWTSSITTLSKPRTNPTGSSRAKRLDCSSSRVMKGRSSCSAMRRTRVVLQRQLIALLQERRQTLITAAVSGKSAVPRSADSQGHR